MPVDRATASLALRALQDRQATQGRLTAQDIPGVSAALGVSPRTVRRWLQRGEVPSGTRRRHLAGDHEITALYAAHGNVKRAYSTLSAAGEPVPSFSTFQRGLQRTLKPDQLAFAREGEPGRRRHETYLKWEPEHRNAVWEVDHTVLNVWVLPERGERPQQPSLIAFIDGSTRAIAGYHLGFTHTASDVLSAMHAAILADEQLGPVCGAPNVITFDNAREYLGDLFSRALVTLLIEPNAAPPYRPQFKGKIERWFRTVDQEFSCYQPWWSGQPRTANPKAFYGPNLPPLTIQELSSRAREWIHEYNTQRPHTALGGQTPAAAWMADHTPLRRFGADELTSLLHHRVQRKINNDGIHLHAVVFHAPELTGLCGEKVEVAYRPNDLREIDVFYDGKHLCRAKPAVQMDADDRIKVLQARREHRDQTAQQRRRASRLQRATWQANQRAATTSSGSASTRAGNKLLDRFLELSSTLQDQPDEGHEHG